MTATDRLAACIRYAMATSSLNEEAKAKLTNELTIHLLEVERATNQHLIQNVIPITIARVAKA